MADASAPRVPVSVDSLYPTADALGAHPFDADLLARYESATHRRTSHLIRRGIFNAQIDFSDAISRTESGGSFYIFLSLTPTNRLFHLRHIVFFQLAKELQDAFNCFLVVHVLDTKACLRDPESKWESAKTACDETIKDVLSFNFNPARTIVLANSNAFSLNYVYLCDLQRRTPLGSFFDPFFEDDQVSIGLVDAVYQNVCFTIPRYLEKVFPNFAELRCLLLLRPSQMNIYKFVTALVHEGPPPMIIVGGFVPALQSFQKMPKLARIAATAPDGRGPRKNPGTAAREYMTLYLKNTPNDIKGKLNKSAFSGGRDPVSDHMQLGAVLEVDVPFYFLRLFERDDKVVETVAREYGPGELPEGKQRMLSGVLKQKVAGVVGAVVQALQKARGAIKPDVIAQMTTVRPLA
jgi:tryptophanyl-tRNA synthetase